MRTFPRAMVRESQNGHPALLLMAPVTSALLLLMVVGPLGRTARAQSLPTDTQGGCPVAPATFATWFESGVPAQDGAVKPADSVAFPGVCDSFGGA